MPRIREYVSKEDSLTPSQQGFAAWETAGRRIGPEYNEAGHLLSQSGELQAKAGAEQLSATERAATQNDKLFTELMNQYRLIGGIDGQGRGTGSGGAGTSAGDVRGAEGGHTEKL